MTFPQSVCDEIRTSCCLDKAGFIVYINVRDLVVLNDSAGISSIGYALRFAQDVGYNYSILMNDRMRRQEIEFVRQIEKADIGDFGLAMTSDFKLKRMMHLTDAIYG